MAIQGRPKIHTDKTKVRISATGKTKLQSQSDRRAIINALVDAGGVMTFGEINEHFGFDISAKVAALIRSGWLEIVAAKKAKKK